MQINKRENMNVLSPSFWFGAKNGLPTFVNSLVDRRRQVGKYLCNLQQNMLLLIKSNSKCSSKALEDAKATLVLSIFFVSCKEKDCYRDFSIGQVGFGSRSILRVRPVYAMAPSESFLNRDPTSVEAKCLFFSWYNF